MYTHILIATDGSELARKGVDAGLALAQALQAAATLVTVSEPWVDAIPGDPTAMALSCDLRDEYRSEKRIAAEALLADLRAKAEAQGIALDTVYVEERSPADAILETAADRQADLIVMASHGRSGLRRLLLGSQTQAVVGRGTLPVLVVR